MKHVLIGLISLLFLTSCEESIKKDTPKKLKVESLKKEKVSDDKSAVVIDANGVANVTINSNDGMRFDVRKINVLAGQKIRLTLNHSGKLDKRIMGHNVVVLKKDIKPSSFAVKAAASKDNDYIPEGSSDVIAYTKIIGGGETTVIEFIAPDVGVYNYICSFPGHFAMMKGKLIVE
tara:strand:- start:675 stop:1202 length:528 start_codon:yes stop_codon:yes gene_type:complete